MTEPEPAPRGRGRGRTPATGKQLLGASWRMLRADSEMLWLPLVGGVAALVAFGLLFVPGYAIGWLIAGQDTSDGSIWIGLALGTFASTVVSVFFQAALVIGANERAEGRDPTRSGVLRLAWTRRGVIVRWAVLATTVGLILRFIQDRLGAAGAIVSLLGGLAWGVATFLVVPVLVAEDVGPVDAVKRSSSVLRDTWGTSLRATLRFGLIVLALWIPAIAVGVSGGYLVAANDGDGAEVAGFVLIGVAVVAIIVFATFLSAITAYAKALIYRYATGQPTIGIDSGLFAGAFTSKG